MSMNALPVELVRKFLHCVNANGTDDLARLTQLNTNWNVEAEALLYSSFSPADGQDITVSSPTSSPRLTTAMPGSSKYTNASPPPPAVLTHVELTLFLIALRKRPHRKILVRSLILPFSSPPFGPFLRLLSSTLPTLTRLEHLHLRGPYPIDSSIQLHILQHAPQNLTSLFLTNAAMRCNPEMSALLKRFPKLKVLGKYPYRSHEPGWSHECGLCETMTDALQGVYLHVDCLRSMLRDGKDGHRGNDEIVRRPTNIKAVQLMRSMGPTEFEECFDVLGAIGEEYSQLSSLGFGAHKFTVQGLDLLTSRLPHLEYLDIVTDGNCVRDHSISTVSGLTFLQEDDVMACWPSALRNLPQLRFFSLQLTLGPNEPEAERWLPCEAFAYGMLLSWGQACPLLTYAYLKIFNRGNKVVSVSWNDEPDAPKEYQNALEWTLARGQSTADPSSYRICQ